jgi:hypothetical protein
MWSCGYDELSIAGLLLPPSKSTAQPELPLPLFAVCGVSRRLAWARQCVGNFVPHTSTLVLLDAQITHAQPRLLPSTSPPNRRASSPIHKVHISHSPFPMCQTRGRHPNPNSGSEPLSHLLYLHYSCTCSPHTRTCMHACVYPDTPPHSSLHRTKKQTFSILA